MLMMVLALQTASAWTVRDNTDNLTGRREVYAMQVSQNEVGAGDFAGLVIDCYEGTVRYKLFWSGRLGTDYVPVKVEWDFGPSARSLGEPTPWRISPYSDDRNTAISSAEDARRLAESVPDGTPFRITVYQTSRTETAYFLSEGMGAVHRRVAAHCAAN